MRSLEDSLRMSGGVSSRMKIVKISIACLIAAAIVLITWWRRESYAQAYQELSDVIPIKIGIRSVINLDWETGFREGCIGAVFEIDEVTVAGLEREGLAFLAGAVRSRKYEDEYDLFEPWKATPMTGGPFYFVDGNTLTDGLACSSPTEETRKLVWHAAQSADSYFAEGHEKVLLLIPKSRMLVVAWVG